MALVKCTECREQVSTLAVSCPKCGAPVRTAEHAPDAERSAWHERVQVVPISKQRRRDRRGFLWLIGIVAALYVLSFPATFVAKSIKEWKEASAREERRELADKQLKARAAEWQQNREPIVAEAKRHFIEGRPAEAVRLLRPWETVLDGEARAVFAAAEPQLAEILAKEKEQAAALFAKEKQAAAKALSDAKEAKEASCRNDLQCWGPRHIWFADTACAPLIEAYAKFDFEWTDGWGEKFDRARLEGDGRITYLGAYIKFQNGFGAWSIMNYECTYDPATKQALHVTVSAR